MGTTTSPGGHHKDGRIIMVDAKNPWLKIFFSKSDRYPYGILIMNRRANNYESNKSQTSAFAYGFSQGHE